MDYFIADLHLGHKNCLSFDNRPFTDIETHDNTIIDNWNNTVGIEDEVYLLGDISWYNSIKTLELLNNLNGEIHLIKGNHDNKILKNRELQKRFCEITSYKELALENNKHIVLCHYPIPCFNWHYYESYHFYGHVHNSFEENIMQHVKLEMEQLYDKPCNMYNVGCMMPYMDYTPRTLEEIIKGE